MTVHCFYHSADLDGACSGAIVKRFISEAVMHQINYGDPFPWDEINPDDTVYMVDFALQPYDLNRKLDSMCNLIIIDHHKSSIEAFVDMKFNPKGSLRVGMAACELTWEYLRITYPTPRAVRLLGRWDVWDHSDPDVEPFQMGMRSYDYSPLTNMTLWCKLLSNETIEQKVFINKIISNGEIIMDYQKQNYYNNLKNLAYERMVVFPCMLELDTLIHYPSIIVNRPFGGSKVFEGYYNPSKHDIMIAYYRNPNKSWTVSLYTDKPEIDVSEICKAMGGGGHKDAGGFQIDDISFLL